MSLVEELAQRVDDAARNARAIAQLSQSHELHVDDAYAIQASSIAHRLGRGEKLVGVKMGFTSVAKARQMGVHELIWGRLTDAMRIPDGGSVSHARYVHPRVEPEVAYRIKTRIDHPLTAAEALRCVDGIAPALELIDSRYENFKFALPDVIADNSSSSGFVVGAWSPADIDVANLGIVLEIDGRAVQFGSSAAILGHPGRSLAAATELATKRGVVLEPGWVIMAGGATEAVALRPGHAVRVSVERLGTASFTVKP